MPKYASSPLRASDDEKTHFRVIMLAFYALGFHIGVWAVLLADLANFLGLGPAALGVALTCQSAAGVVALLVGGRLADRFGRRPVLVVGVAATGAYLSLLAFVDSYPAFVAVLVFSGVVSMYDLACNSFGGDYERRHDAKAMTLFHAGFLATARATPCRSGQATSLVTASGYFAFTLSPIVVGGLADASSFRLAFLLLLTLCLGMSILSRRMPE